MSKIGDISLVPVPSYLGLAPKNAESIMGIAVPFLFTGNEPLEFDFIDFAQQNLFGTLQSVWIENVTLDANRDPIGNAGTFTLRVGGLEQNLYVPSFSVGMFPCIASGPGKFAAYHSLTGTPLAPVRVRAIFLNVPQPYFAYSVS